MIRLAPLRSTFAASALVLLLAGPALAALPPGLVEDQPVQETPATPATPPEAPPPAAAPRAPGNGQMVWDPDFQVQNRARRAIITLNVSSSRLDDWGENLLGRGRIEPGQNFMVQLERNRDCEYDVRVVYEGGREETRMRENVCALNEIVFVGAPTATEDQPPPGQPGQVRVVDALRQQDPPEERQPPRRNGRLQPDQRQPPQPAERQRQANARPDIWVVNRSTVEIVQIQSSPISDPNWGQNRLTGQPVAAGARYALMLPGNLGCDWDIRITYRGGQTEERRNVNFCEIEQLEFAGQRRTSR